MDASEVLAEVGKLKRLLSAAMKKEDDRHALALISHIGFILYQANLFYVDEDLEKCLGSIAERTVRIDGNAPQSDKILFFDGFGYNDRGLIQVYMRALCAAYSVIYVTYLDRKDAVPDVLRQVEEHQGLSLFIDRGKSWPERIRELNDIINRYQPRSIFCYILPYDPVCPVVLTGCPSRIRKYMVNLTDHAFWIGASCCDRYIEFRDYGARVSEKYRGIPRDKIVKILFYPMISREKEFQGFPFDRSGKTVVFSGGQLYKTFSKDRLYYIMVERMLQYRQDIVFWYAGSGDASELIALKNRYPDRVYHTAERTDLFQVLQNCDIYLSTYPVCGGLMFQYAAEAGVIPLTLKNGDISDGFLKEQDRLGIEFDNPDALMEKFGKLVSDPVYHAEQRKRICNAVVSEEEFGKRVGQLIDGSLGNGDICFGDIRTEDFRQVYLDRIDRNLLGSWMLNRDTFAFLLRKRPLWMFRAAAQRLAVEYKSRILPRIRRGRG